MNKKVFKLEIDSEKELTFHWQKTIS